MGRRCFILFCSFVALAILSPVQAQDWPTRPVTIVHPFPPGGGADFVLRALAQALTDKLGQPFVVDNRSGAGGTIGTAYAARAAPDGYTFVMTAVGPAVLSQYLVKSLPYDTDKDLTPVVMVGEIPQLMVSDPKLGFKTLQDLIEFGRKNPGKLNIGHAGVGSMGHLAAILFLARTGIRATLIAYRGAVPVVTDVLSGAIQAGVPIYVPPARNTSMLAVMSEQRVSFLPDVPTAREGGVDLVVSTWTGIMAPAGVPEDIVKKLNAAVNAFLASPEGAKQFTKVGIRVLGGTPQHFAEVIKQDRALWAPVIAKEHIKLDAK